MPFASKKFLDLGIVSAALDGLDAGDYSLVVANLHVKPVGRFEAAGAADLPTVKGGRPGIRFYWSRSKI